MLFRQNIKLAPNQRVKLSQLSHAVETVLILESVGRSFVTSPFVVSRLSVCNFFVLFYAHKVFQNFILNSCAHTYAYTHNQALKIDSRKMRSLLVVHIMISRKRNFLKCNKTHIKCCLAFISIKSIQKALSRHF